MKRSVNAFPWLKESLVMKYTWNMQMRKFSSVPGTAIRLASLAGIIWSVYNVYPGHGSVSRNIVTAIAVFVGSAAWLVWTWRAMRRKSRRSHAQVHVEIYAMGVAGGLLCETSTYSAASAFPFVAVVAAGILGGVKHAVFVVIASVAGLLLGHMLPNVGGLGPLWLLAYSLGLIAAAFGGTIAHQHAVELEHAEELASEVWRTHEEQVRSARLEESARIARDIHDVLAHTLTGLVVQLEVVQMLIDQGSDREDLRSRLAQAHALARQGMADTKRALGVLQGVPQKSVVDTLRSLVAHQQTLGHGEVSLTLDGDTRRLEGAHADTLVRVIQEALTNAAKHAEAALVTVVVDAGEDAADDIVAVVEDCAHPTETTPTRADDEDASSRFRPTRLASSGSGLGLAGMLKRAELSGGSLVYGPTERGWRVELRLPPHAKQPK